MNEKTIELKYSLTREHVLAAYELSGERKKRFESNRNTTICFVVIIALFTYNLINAIMNDGDKYQSYMMYTSIAFIAFSLIMIAITWFGGKSAVNDKIKGISDGTEYKVFINKNGFSYIFGEGEETAVSRGDFLIKSNSEIYLLMVGTKKLIIPKSAIKPEDTEALREYLL